MKSLLKLFILLAKFALSNVHSLQVPISSLFKRLYFFFANFSSTLSCLLSASSSLKSYSKSRTLFFGAHLLLSLFHPWNQTGQSIFTSMTVSVFVIVVERPLSPQPIPRQSGNTMVVVVVVVVIVAVVGAHCM